MLVEFRVTNFRSFRDTQVLSLVADTDKEHLESNTFDSGISRFGRLVASAAIYGPNAAGKTNLLKALQFMQSLVVGSATSNPISPLSYTPFKFDLVTRKAPSEFAATIADPDSGLSYEYGFSIDADRVHHEWLTEYGTKPSRIFERTFVDGKYEWTFGKALRGNRTVWRDSTRQNALFLSTAVQLNSMQLLPVSHWFQKRLVVVVGNSTFNRSLTLSLASDPSGKDRLLSFIRQADPNIADLQVNREPLRPGVVFSARPFVEQMGPDMQPTIAKVTFSHRSNNKKELVGINLFDESNGTQVLFTNAGAWLNVFTNGEVLLVDEIDSSLHPLLVKFLIEQFHGNRTNPRHAQLVFTTHNTSLLNQTIFRRDQIWFVEKSPENFSRCYPLTDFSPRKDEIIERWYMRGRYGALPIFASPES